MRPLYQTVKDADKEKQVLDILAKEWGCHISPTPVNCPYDGVVMRPAGYVEVRCRKYSKHDFKTYHISKRKVDGLLELDLPVVLVVKWKDGVLWTMLREGYETTNIGRNQMRDEWDREIGYEIPMSEFKEL